MGGNPTFPLKLTVESTKVCWQEILNLRLLCVDNGMSLNGHLRGTDVFSPRLFPDLPQVSERRQTHGTSPIRAVLSLEKEAPCTSVNYHESLIALFANHLSCTAIHQSPNHAGFFEAAPCLFHVVVWSCYVQFRRSNAHGHGKKYSL